MPIIDRSEQRIIELHGGATSYILHIDDAGHLVNLHWGHRVSVGSIHAEMDKYIQLGFEQRIACTPQELPTRGRGWYGTPAVAVQNSQGNDVVDLIYVNHDVFPGKRLLNGLPATYVESADEADTLEIHLQDELTGLKVTVVYCIYAASGAMTRSLRITNCGDQPVTLAGILSASTPLPGRDYDVIHLRGAWTRERQAVRQPIGQGEYRIFSQRGASGHEENPFMALCHPYTTEHTGEVWAVNLVYSGSFLACAAVDAVDNARLSIGLNPDTFAWHLTPGEVFVSPEAVMVYSCEGLNGMSHVYHELYRTRLVRGPWRDRVRPILVNNWEGTYFDFDEDKLLDIARAAQKLGIELFVLDDGWFGKRDTDNCSLGDWVVDRRKLPHGLDGLAKEINALGMQFGLWFEPEMVSPDSDLYRAHPDWCLHVEGRSRTLGRQQLILDLSRQEVQDYIIDAVSAVLSSAPISYVKWDMNRNMTEHFSGDQMPERQMETQHRYILGLYRVMEELFQRFPQVLFEGCAGGGGRFDPGMLYYMPQIWTSDDTDAVERLSIQYGTSFAYPASAMGAHVSAVPNHQTGRATSLSMRGDVALGGNFGFELDMSAMSQEELVIAQSYVEKVKAVRHLTQKGEFNRLISPFEGQYAAWQFVSAEKDEALLCIYRALTKPRMPDIRVRMVGLDENARYTDDAGHVHAGAALMYHGVWAELEGDFSSRVIHFRRENVHETV